jgi:hypothetical protein
MYVIVMVVLGFALVAFGILNHSIHINDAVDCTFIYQSI